MAAPIALYLRHFPQHAHLIGDMLVGYADMETFVISLVSLGLRRDVNLAVKILGRVKGAEDRINMADAVLRQHMTGLGLLGAYSQFLGAMRRCRIIRNQYAHCAWETHGEGLAFVNLNEMANSNDPVVRVPVYPISLELLEEQHAFFDYTLDLITYLRKEASFRMDRRRRHNFPLPKSRAVPKLHNRQRG